MIRVLTTLLVLAAMAAVSAPDQSEAACGILAGVRARREARATRRAERRGDYAVCVGGACAVPQSHAPLAPPPPAR